MRVLERRLDEEQDVVGQVDHRFAAGADQGPSHGGQGEPARFERGVVGPGSLGEQLFQAVADRGVEGARSGPEDDLVVGRTPCRTEDLVDVDAVEDLLGEVQLGTPPLGQRQVRRHSDLRPGEARRLLEPFSLLDFCTCDRKMRIDFAALSRPSLGKIVQMCFEQTAIAAQFEQRTSRWRKSSLSSS